MSDSVGLSVGMTHFVAARAGGVPLTRRAVLTLFPHRAPEVGVPSDNPNLTEPGLVMTGFVERVGDPVPLVAPDGSTHRAEQLLVEALDAMVSAVGSPPPSNVTIAVPAHWGPAVLGALRALLRTKPNLSPHGVAPPLLPDAAAALAALQVSPGLPTDGLVALLDLGGSGTNITLADAANNFEPIDQTVHYTEFSGDQIDQALLTHVLSDIGQAGGMDPTGTIAVGALTRLRDQARLAKERLSAETAAELPAELPGYQSNIRVTRTELEGLIRGPFAGVMFTLEELMQRNRIAGANLAAVATVGGGASIPLITQRLSEHFRVPVVTTEQPALASATGAALIAARGPADASTGLAPAPTGLAPAADAQTAMGEAAWAAGAAGMAAGESAADGAASATFRALAWSEERGAADEPMPYSGTDYDYDPGATGARPQLEFLPPEEPASVEEPLPWYRRPQLIFAAAAVLLLAAVGGLAYTLTSKAGSSGGTPTATSPAVTNPKSPGVPLTETVTVTGSNGSPTVVTPPAPPPAPGPNPTSQTPTTTETTTTTEPTTTTTTATTTYTTTTTTQPTTTTPPVTTTTAPPTTTSAAPPTSRRPIITLFPRG